MNESGGLRGSKDLHEITSRDNENGSLVSSIGKESQFVKVDRNQMKIRLSWNDIFVIEKICLNIQLWRNSIATTENNWLSRNFLHETFCSYITKLSARYNKKIVFDNTYQIIPFIMFYYTNLLFHFLLYQFYFISKHDINHVINNMFTYKIKN